MSGSENNPAEFVTVVCSVCGGSVEAAVQKEAAEVSCPGCSAPIAVPSRSEIEARGIPTRFADEANTYRLVADAEEKETVPLQAREEVVPLRVRCPACGHEWRVEGHTRLQHLSCPACFEIVPLPTGEMAGKEKRSAADRQRRRKKRRRSGPGTESPPLGESGTPEGGEKGPAVIPALEDRLAEIRREPLPPPPRFPFFEGVFELPWRHDVVVTWGYLSLGWLLTGLVAAVIQWVWAEGVVYAAGFFFLPLFWLLLMSGSFGISRCLTILEQTGNGSDRISGWTEGGWREWLTDTLPVLYLAALACVVSSAVARVTVPAGGGLCWLVGVLIFLFVFPIILLSSLQAGSVWVPFTATVLRSLYRQAKWWLLYFALAWGVALVYFGIVYAGLRAGLWFATLTLTAPLLAAVQLIEARLLGRLAWCLSHSERKRKRKKPPMTDG